LKKNNENVFCRARVRLPAATVAVAAFDGLITADHARRKHIGFYAHAAEKPFQRVPTDVRRVGPTGSQRHRGQCVPVEGPTRPQLHRRGRDAIARCSRRVLYYINILLLLQ